MTEERKIGLGPGLAGFILVVVIAWALAAVLMLTGTLTNARQINQRVKVIDAWAPPVKQNLSSVALAARTGRISAQINQAAQPLSGELSQVLVNADAINKKVGLILGHAHSINGTVNSINSNARQINASVHGINGTVHSINSNVQSIGASVSSIGASVDSIHARVSTIQGAVGPIAATDSSINGDIGSINGDIGSINGDFGGILSNVISIRDRLSLASDKVAGIINLAGAIKSDFDKVLAGLGTALGTATIVGHANSIDCSRLINALGPTRGCGK